MADTTTLEDLINYYVRLLIIQYSNQPKAQATIALFADTLLASNIILQVQDAYNIIEGSDDELTWDTPGDSWDTPGLAWGPSSSGIAVGVQLDVLGKYVGIDRFYPGINLENYFSLVTEDEYGSLPTSPPRFGFSDYVTFGAFSYNGTLVYNDIVTVQNALSDEVFYFLIQLKIIQNNSNYSHGAIDTQLFDFFGTNIRAESTGGMHMIFFVSVNVGVQVSVLIYKKLFPVPLGVGYTIVEGVQGQMFALTDYTRYESVFGYGFSTYDDYATLAGQILVYSQILQG